MAENLLAGLAQGFSQGKIAGQQNKQQKEMRDLQVKAFKANLEALDAQRKAKEQFFSQVTPQPQIEQPNYVTQQQSTPFTQSLFQGAQDLNGNGPLQSAENTGGFLNKLLAPIENAKAPEQKQTLMQMLTSDPKLQMLGVQSGIITPKELIDLQLYSNTANMMGNKDFVLSSVKYDSQGHPMYDFTKPKVSREIPTPDGKSFIQQDQFGNEVGRRPVGPNERPQNEIKAEGLAVQQQFKLKPALATVDKLEGLYDNIINASSISEKAIAMKIYDDFVTGTIAPLIRAGGESGSLATEDTQRALKLPPGGMSALTGYTSAIGKKKFTVLRDWFKGIGGNNASGGKVVDFKDLP